MADAVERVLFVHGYELVKQGGIGIKLGSQAELVCQSVSEIQADYTRIVMLGGWGGTAGIATTTGKWMSDRLKELGVPAEKIIIASHIPALTGWMPARDTGEECRLVGIILYLPEFRKQHIRVDSIAMQQWVPRIRFIYAALHILYARLIPVQGEVPFDQRVREKVAYNLACFFDDPFGTKLFSGALFKHNRKKRTMSRSSSLKPLTQ